MGSTFWIIGSLGGFGAFTVGLGSFLACVPQAFALHTFGILIVLWLFQIGRYLVGTSRNGLQGNGWNFDRIWNSVWLRFGSWFARAFSGFLVIKSHRLT